MRPNFDIEKKFSIDPERYFFLAIEIAWKVSISFFVLWILTFFEKEICMDNCPKLFIVFQWDQGKRIINLYLRRRNVLN